MTEESLPDALARTGMLRLGPQTTFLPLADLQPVLSAEGMNGQILIYALCGHWLVVEPVPGGDRVIRSYASRQEAEEFMSRRLEQFDRLWDGCGCGIDYDSREPGW